MSGAELVAYVRNGLFADMELCANSAELSGAGLAERLAEGAILPMYGMPSRVRLLYHGFRGREALSIDRDLDLAITEFAPGSQKTKDKRVYTAIGFTGPLLPDPAWHPATDNPFPRRMWMARCDQCHYVNKEQLMLYAALYQCTFGVWPARLEVVPLQGAAVAVPFDAAEADGLLADAVAFLQDANRRIAEVEIGRGTTVGLASPYSGNCRLCLFRPACQAYWSARTQGSKAKWPADVRGVVHETTRLRNGKVCMRIAQSDQPRPSCITVRNLTDGAARHPLLDKAQLGSMVALYGLEHNYRSGDYTETQNTVCFVTT